MPTISENEMNDGVLASCVECQQHEGSIFLCGEGYLCESCYAKAAGIPEEAAFEPPQPEDKDVARESLAQRRTVGAGGSIAQG